MSSIDHHLAELSVFVDDLLTARPALAHWRHSPHPAPQFTDAEVLTLALLQGCLGVASLKQTYRLVAANCRSAFPHLCSSAQWLARLHGLSSQISALLSATTQMDRECPPFYLLDAKPIPLCHRLRHGRVRRLREDGAWLARPARAGFSASSCICCSMSTDGFSISC